MTNREALTMILEACRAIEACQEPKIPAPGYGAPDIAHLRTLPLAQVRAVKRGARRTLARLRAAR